MAGVPVRIPGTPGIVENRQEMLRQAVQWAWNDREPFDGLPPRFTDFRQSENVDDRRDERWWSQNSPSQSILGFLMSSAKEVFGSNSQPGSPLSLQAGFNDIPIPDADQLKSVIYLNR